MNNNGKHENKKELAKETKEWLSSFDDWSIFVKKNALQSFVEKTSLIPISLKTGKPIRINELKTYDAIPKTYEEFLDFFVEVSKRITLRNECIFREISKNN